MIMEMRDGTGELVWSSETGLTVYFWDYYRSWKKKKKHS